MGLAEVEHVVVHGFIEDGENQEWCQVHDPKATGFSVYRRTATSEDGQFDVLDEQDFTNLHDADNYARTLANNVLEIFVD